MCIDGAIKKIVFSKSPVPNVDIANVRVQYIAMRFFADYPPPLLDFVAVQYVECVCMQFIRPASSVDEFNLLVFIVNTAVKYFLITHNPQPV